MYRKYCAAIIAALGAVAPVFASENSSILWKDVGSWTIRVVDEGVSFCEASAFWPGGTRVTLGYSANRPTPRLVVTNPQWQKLNSSKDYELIVQFGSQAPWRTPSLRSASGDDVGLRIEGRDLLFFEEMMGAQSFGVRVGDDTVAQFDMNGAFSALAELGSCQSNVAGVRGAKAQGAS